MKNNILRKGFVLEIFIIFFGIAVLPCVNGNSIVEKKTLDYQDTCVEFAIYRLYVVGPIYNLSYNESTNYFIFISKNLRLFEFYVYFNQGNLDWRVSYKHSIDASLYDYSGDFLKFRGLLKPTFICGYFYLNFLTP
jgi:hypothetical protein